MASACVVSTPSECSFDVRPTGLITSAACLDSTLVITTYAGVFLYDVSSEPIRLVAAREEPSLMQAYRVVMGDKRFSKNRRYIGVAAGSPQRGDVQVVVVLAVGYNFLLEHGLHGRSRITALALVESSDGKCAAVSGDEEGRVCLLDISRGGTSTQLLEPLGFSIRSLCGVPANSATPGSTLLVATADVVMLHTINPQWQAMRSIPVVLEEASFSSITSLMSPLPPRLLIGRPKGNFLVLNDDGSDAGTLGVALPTKHERCVAACSSDGVLAVQWVTGDVVLLERSGEADMQATQFAFNASKYKRDRRSGTTLTPLSFGIGRCPSFGTQRLAAFVLLSDGMTMLYTPLLRDEKPPDYLHSASPHSNASPAQSPSAVMMSKFAAAAESLGVFDRSKNSGFMARTMFTSLLASRSSSSPPSPTPADAPTPLSVTPEPSVPAVPAVIAHVKPHDRRRRNKVLVPSHSDAAESNPDEYIRSQVAQLEAACEAAGTLIVDSSKADAVERELGVLLDVDEPALRNALKKDEFDERRSLFATFEHRMQECREQSPKAAGPTRCSGGPRPARLHFLSLALEKIRRSPRFSAKLQRVLLDRNHRHLLPRPAQLCGHDPVFTETVSKLQHQDRKHFELADLRVRQESELAAIVDEEELVLEENEKRDPRGNWAPFKIRFQNLDGSAVDMKHLEEAHGREWTWCEDHVNEEDAPMGYPGWRTGLWRYARVWPASDPAPPDFWRFDKDLVGTTQRDAMRVRRRCIYRRRRSILLHRKKEALRVLHRQQVQKLEDALFTDNKL